MQSMPAQVRAYRRTPEFSESSVPDVWLGAHATKRDVWGKIVVLEGRLLFVLTGSGEEFHLDADHPGVIEPRVTHLVRPLGRVRFYIEFYR